jgi:transcriptional regulator with XRE-family HTH domain
VRKYTAFGIKARSAMLKKGITMTALAKRFEISTAYVSYIFKGEKSGDNYKDKIAEYLGIKKGV